MTIPQPKAAAKWAARFRPRRWQEEALALWQERERGVVSVVTGGGKTAFAELCMLAFRDRYPQGRFIIVVPTAALLDQWYVSLEEDLGVGESEIACYSGLDHPDKPRAVNLLVVNTARAQASKISRGAPSFLIVDECHRVGSPANALALRGDYAAALGLSATPEREYDEGFEQHVSPTLGEIIYRYDYRQAAQDGVVSPFEIVNVKTDLLPDEEDAFRALSRRAALEAKRISDGHGSEDKLKRILQQRAAVSATAVMRLPVAAKLVDEHRGERTLVFHERVEAANRLLAIVRQRRHNATIYHTGIGATIRRDNLRLFRRGLFDVLISCRALDEGTNVPETTVAVIASATASHRQRVQRLGRVLRPAPGKAAAVVYTIYATEQEERRLRAEEQEMDGVAAVRWLRGGRRHA